MYYRQICVFYIHAHHIHIRMCNLPNIDCKYTVLNAVKRFKKKKNR